MFRSLQRFSRPAGVSRRSLQRRNWVQIGLRPNGGEKLLGDRLTGGGGPSRNPAAAGVVRADGFPERLPGAESRQLQHLTGVGRLWCGEGTVAQGSAQQSRASGRARVLGCRQRNRNGAQEGPRAPIKGKQGILGRCAPHGRGGHGRDLRGEETYRGTAQRDPP